MKNIDQTKIFVIGLDGADFFLINEFKEDLSNLKKLIEEGVYCKLRSTIPIISPTAWASFMTGKNPCKHGIFDFLYRDRNDPTEQGKPVSFANINSTTLWRILSDNNRKVGVFNVPMTYPPEKVNGFIIGGFMVPRNAEDYTYPRELANELKSKGWNFADVATQSYSKKYLDVFLSELYQRIRDRTEATLYLMSKYEWDFFMVHFMESDKVLHEFLNYNYEHFTEKKFRKYKNVVKDFFIEIDDQLGNILNALDKKTNIFVVSDHGFSPSRNVVYLDTWLLNNKHIRLRNNMPTKIRYLMFRSGITVGNLYRILPEAFKFMLRKKEDERYYARSFNFVNKLVKKLENLPNAFFLSKRDVDWHNTEAYSYGNMGFFINLRGRECEGIIENDEYEKLKEKLKNELREIVNSSTQKQIFDRIHTKEEIYPNEYLSNAMLPDIIAFDSSQENIAVYHPKLFMSNNLLSKNYFFPDRAGHNLNGILIACGPDIKRGEAIEEAQIVDVTPTILHMFGLAVLQDMDGRVLKEIFKEGSDPRRWEVRYKEVETKVKETFRISNEDEEEILRRLKAMGYL